MRVVHFIQAAVMLCWRMALLSLVLFTLAPGWNGYPYLVIGVPLIASTIIVFGLHRCLRPFPLARLLAGKNPLPTQAEVAADAASAAEQARRRSPQYQQAARRRQEQSETAARLQRDQAAIAAHRQAELDHARRVAQAGREGGSPPPSSARDD